MSKQNWKMLIRWYRERIRYLTNRVEEALLNGLALGYIEELKEMRDRFEELLEELLKGDNTNDKNDEP